MRFSLFIKTSSVTLRLGADYLLRNRLRFILIPLVFVLLKIIGALWLSQRLDGRAFLSIFHGWDSFYYMSITSNWYPSMASEIWAFFPFYPFCSYLVNLVLYDIRLSMALISFLAGVMWIPIYQTIAERYMDVREAFTSTCIFASFPQVFLFTTIAYSEPLFLLTTLAAWLLYLRGRILGSCVLACFATLTRPYGILIVLPIFLGLLKRKFWKRVPLISLPIASLLGWFLYSFFKTGNYFAFLNAQEYWKGMPWQPKNWIQGFLLPQLGIEPTIQATTPLTPFSVYILLAPFIALTACLIIMSFKADWRLGFYGIGMFGMILYFGTPLSMPRFLPFIFPVWLYIKTRIGLIAFAICIIFYLHSLVIWYLFSQNIWVG